MVDITILRGSASTNGAYRERHVTLVLNFTEPIISDDVASRYVCSDRSATNGRSDYAPSAPRFAEVHCPAGHAASVAIRRGSRQLASPARTPRPPHQAPAAPSPRSRHRGTRCAGSRPSAAWWGSVRLVAEGGFALCVNGCPPRGQEYGRKAR